MISPETEANVYRFFLEEKDLPETDQGMMSLATNYARQLLDQEPLGLTSFTQLSQQGELPRITIIVPSDRSDLDLILRNAGHLPAFTEPQQPYVENNSCTVPMFFQMKHFHTLINPQTIANHPDRLHRISQALKDAVPDLPDAAHDFLNWTSTASDEETYLLTIHWNEPNQNRNC